MALIRSKRRVCDSKYINIEQTKLGWVYDDPLSVDVSRLRLPRMKTIFPN